MALPRYLIPSKFQTRPVCLATDTLPPPLPGIWKVIRSWLDPVVASKIHFTNNLKDLEGFVAPSRVLKELDGEEDFTYRYVEPAPGENAKMGDTATRDRKLAAREQLYREYEEATLQWIRDPEGGGEGAQAVKARRDGLAAKLREDYWALDPYVRARSLYDRTRVLQGEKVEPYPAPDPAADAKSEVAEGQNGTSADDVD